MNIMDILKKPAVIAVISLIVGLFLGLTYAYVLDPKTFTDQPMTWTRPDLQEGYLRMAIDLFRVNRDPSLAGARYHELGASAKAAYDDIKAKSASGEDPIDPRVLDAFDNAIAPYAPTGDATSTDNAGGFPWWIVIILVAVLLIGAVWFFILKPLLRSNRRAPEDMTPAMLAAEHSRSVEKTDYSTVSSTPPVAQYVTTYVLGDDLFDDSFSIDAPSGEFLGECGVGISETVGVGDPKKVTAFEVWMFDKNDIQTITKVLMSTSAFSDMALRSKLEPKGELVQVDPRKQVLLETQTLQMIATVSDMQYGQGALPNGSYFDRITIELAIWQKAK